MAPAKKEKKTCPNGHTYYKSSDCPTCPVCEAERKPESGFFSKIAAPARRALEHEGITTPAALSKYSEREILKLHGMGPSTIPTLEKELKEGGLSFEET